jgi:hypothetical protein
VSGTHRVRQETQSAEDYARTISGALGPRCWAAVYEGDDGTTRLAAPADQDPATTYRLLADAVGTLTD